MKTVTVRYAATFIDHIEVPDDWTWDGSLEALLEYTDMPYEQGDLLDWQVER